MGSYCPSREKVVFILLFFVPTSAQCLTINDENTWGGMFAGEVVPYEITLTGKQNSYVSLHWKLKSKGRTLSNGQKPIRFGSGDTVTTTLPLQAPSIKPGISLEAKLIIEMVDGVDSSQVVLHESKINIYGPDLFLTDRYFYQQLNIRLFDPVGKTSKIFNDLKIPYQLWSKSQLMNSVEKGLIVVGAEVDLDNQRGLISELIKLSREGQHVLILQPSSGDVSISQLSEETSIQPSTIYFSDNSVVQSFAKGYRWITDDAINGHGIALQSYRQAVLAKILEDGQRGWQWLSISFDQSGGRFIICMLPFLEYMGQGPVPQIIFSRLLAYINEKSFKLTHSQQRKK